MEDPRRDPYAPPKRTQPGPLPQRAPDDELLWKRRILKATVFLGVVYAFLAVDRLIPSASGAWIRRARCVPWSPTASCFPASSFPSNWPGPSD